MDWVKHEDLLNALEDAGGKELSGDELLEFFKKPVCETGVVVIVKYHSYTISSSDYLISWEDAQDFQEWPVDPEWRAVAEKVEGYSLTSLTELIEKDYTKIKDPARRLAKLFRCARARLFVELDEEKLVPILEPLILPK